MGELVGAGDVAGRKNVFVAGAQSAVNFDAAAVVFHTDSLKTEFRDVGAAAKGHQDFGCAYCGFSPGIVLEMDAFKTVFP